MAVSCGATQLKFCLQKTSVQRKLFTNFPKVVKAVRELADRFVAFVQGHLAALHLHLRIRLGLVCLARTEGLRPLLLQLKDEVLHMRLFSQVAGFCLALHPLQDAVFKVKKLLTKGQKGFERHMLRRACHAFQPGIDKAQVILAEEADSKRLRVQWM